MTSAPLPAKGLRRKLAVLGVLTGFLATGCGFSGIYDTPLPGGADIGEHPVTVHVMMRNVDDLVPQAAVKVNDVPIGRVGKIRVATDPNGTWVADVTMEINGDQRIPADATASLKQTSLLGEKYINLNTEGTAEQASLHTGQTIKESDRSQHVETEEVLGALSLLLNNGGLAQIRSISRELNNATSGNEGAIRALLSNVNSLAGGLDAHSRDITRALDGLNRLSGTLNGQKRQLANVIDNIGPGLKVLRDQRVELVHMLEALDHLSGVAVDTVNRSKADLVADLRTLSPTLRTLGEAGQDLPNALQLLASFPFPDATVSGIKGDYLNVYADVDLDLTNILTNLGRSRQAFPGPLSIPGLDGVFGPRRRSGNSPSGSTSGSADTRQAPNGGGDTGGQTPPSGLSGLLGSLLGGGS
ncbi:MAG: MCE family protein [Sciscionella sp.]